MARIPVDPNSVTIFPISSTGEINSNSSIILPINPESYQDNKTNTGWIANIIPGQSLPVYQWVASGPRIISFEALVTKDTSYLNSSSGSLGQQALKKLTNAATNALGSIASNFFGASIPIGSLLGSLSDTPTGLKSLISIEDILTSLRSLYYPTYSNDGTISSSPPLIYLGIGIGGDTNLTAPDSIGKYTEVYILTSLSINITKQLNDSDAGTLRPMEALVTMQFEQYPITAPDSTSAAFPSGPPSLSGATLPSSFESLA